MKTLLTLGDDFNRRHRWLLAAAKYSGVALCGGCAAAVTKVRTDYVPRDIDFAATESGATQFINLINGFLLKRSAHFRIYGNSRNAFVPSRATAHFRITCSFWLPVCLFVLPDDAFRAYRIKGGHLLQIYEDIKQSADELTEIDSKPRLASEPDEAASDTSTKLEKSETEEARPMDCVLRVEMDEDEIRGKVTTDGWDEHFAESVIESTPHRVGSGTIKTK